jgi:hypothetical protein
VQAARAPDEAGLQSDSVVHCSKVTIFRFYISILQPYRGTMDAGCGSATVLMLLQVLIWSCYGREALIRSTMGKLPDTWIT